MKWKWNLINQENIFFRHSQLISTESRKVEILTIASGFASSENRWMNKKIKVRGQSILIIEISPNRWGDVRWGETDFYEHVEMLRIANEWRFYDYVRLFFSVSVVIACCSTIFIFNMENSFSFSQNSHIALAHTFLKSSMYHLVTFENQFRKSFPMETSHDSHVYGRWVQLEGKFMAKMGKCSRESREKFPL